MRRLGSSLVVIAFGFGSLFAASGCEVQECENEDGEDALCLKSLTRFNGADDRETVPYTPGTDLTVAGIYGDIDVVEGVRGELGVLIERFNYRAYDAEEQAREELENNFDYSVDESNEAITVTTGRHDATNGLGADITVYLPPEFDGALVLQNESDGPVNPGDVDAKFVGDAWFVELSTEHLGDCRVEGADGAVVSTRARCDGAIEATNVYDYVDLEATGLEHEVLVTLAGVTGADAGGTIENEDGDIRVEFPAGSDFTVQAQASADGEVVAPELEDDCVTAIAAENSKSFTCGDGGPNFVVTAGTDGVGPSAVRIDRSP